MASRGILTTREAGLVLRIMTLPRWCMMPRHTFRAGIRQKTLDRHLDLFAAATGKSRESLQKYSGAFTLIRLMQALGAFGFRGLHENKPTFTESIVPAVELMNELLGGDALQIDLPELKKASEAVPLQRKYRILSHYQELVKINLESFSYVKGKTINYDNGSGFVFDCRGLRNPATVTELSELTGLDPEVAEFFGNDDEAVAFVGDCTNIIRNSLPMMRRKGILEINAAFGCVGGRHRSVWCAVRVASMLQSMPGVTSDSNPYSARADEGHDLCCRPRHQAR